MEGFWEHENDLDVSANIMKHYCAGDLSTPEGSGEVAFRFFNIVIYSTAIVIFSYNLSQAVNSYFFFSRMFELLPCCFCLATFLNNSDYSVNKFHPQGIHVTLVVLSK